VITSRKELPFSWSVFDRHTEKGFLSTIRNQLEKEEILLEVDYLLNRIVVEADHVFKSHLDYAVDKPSQGHLLLVSYIWAADEVLSGPLKEPGKVKSILVKAVCDPGRFFVKWSMRLSLMLARDKMKMMKDGATRKLSMYGKQFSMECKEPDDNTFIMLVSTCGFHEFFKQKGKPELTDVLCEWDKIWYQEINPHRDGIAFELTETLASGGECCCFKMCVSS